MRLDFDEISMLSSTNEDARAESEEMMRTLEDVNAMEVGGYLHGVGA